MLSKKYNNLRFSHGGPLYQSLPKVLSRLFSCCFTSGTKSDDPNVSVSSEVPENPEIPATEDRCKKQGKRTDRELIKNENSGTGTGNDVNTYKEETKHGHLVGLKELDETNPDEDQPTLEPKDDQGTNNTKPIQPPTLPNNCQRCKLGIEYMNSLSRDDEYSCDQCEKLKHVCNLCRRIASVRCFVGERNNERMQQQQKENLGEEMSTLLKRAQSQVRVLKEWHSQASQNLAQLPLQEKEARHYMEQRFEDINSWTKKARGELLETISLTIEKLCAQLRARETRAKDTADNLNDLITCASVSSPQTVNGLQLKIVDLKKALLAEEKIEEYQVRLEVERNVLSVNHVSKAVDFHHIRDYIGQVSGDLREEQIDKLKARVLLRRGKMQSLAVAFQACTQVKVKNLPKVKDTIRADVVSTNQGDSYEDGIFTAPITGQYKFEATITVRFPKQRKRSYNGGGNKRGNTVSIGLCIDEEIAAEATCSRHRKQASITQLVSVTKDQKVRLKNLETRTVRLLCNGVEPAVTFSGFLINTC